MSVICIPVVNEMKKKVLIIPDVEGWAYDIIAQHIMPHFQRYIPTIRYMRDIIRGTEKISFGDFDVVFVFFWYDGFTNLMDIDDFDINKVCVGIHSHNSWIKRNIPIENVKEIVNLFPVIGCISRKLMAIFEDHHSLCFTPSGYAPEFFQPSPLPQFNGVLKVAWAGDPQVAHHGDVKGFHSIIKPVISELDEVELIVQTKEERIPYHQMSRVYNSAHVYLNTSLNEGSPMPVIEAMACGRAVISTDVGIVPELIDDSNGVIIPRTHLGLREALLDLHSKPEKLTLMGINARKSIECRSWAWSAEHYEKMFDRVLKNKQEKEYSERYFNFT